MAFLAHFLLVAFLTHAESTRESFKPLENPTSYRRNYRPIKLVNWSWRCQEGHCIRFQPNISGDANSTSYSYPYLEGCKSVCGQYGSLWPFPTGRTTIQAHLTAFNIEDIAVKFDPKEPHQGLEEALTESWSIFSQYLALMATGGSAQKAMVTSKRAQVLVKVSVVSKSLNLDLKTDESYSLSVSTREQDLPRDEILIVIKAHSFYGARHALETLSQLITYDPQEHCHRIPTHASIDDKPSYPYRGILLDTGRNYYSVASLKRVVDGMSYNKLNVLHWHMNEQQSFPFVSEHVPNLTSYGAYSPEEVYYKDEIKGLVMYARQRGVLLLPELDGPAHAAYGWQFGPDANLGNLVTCQDRDWEDESGTLSAEPPAGQLNPVNENVYKILGELYKDLIAAFTPMHSKEPLRMFHMGGDEVNFKCWEKEPEIQDWLMNQQLNTDPGFNAEGFLYLWSVFQEKALRELTKANGGQKFTDGIILWTSELTKPGHISRFLDATKYIIQVWTNGSDSIIGGLLKQRYRLIMSNYDAWYLDCGYGAWLYSGVGPENNWCSPFKGWKTVYKNNMRHMVAVQGLDWHTYGKLILGGEATMWSEQSDEFSVEAKLWPRGCAFAERLWSDPQETTWREAEQRILEQRRRIAIERGLHADVIQPEFCRQHDGKCYTLRKYAVMTSVDDVEPFVDHDSQRQEVIHSNGGWSYNIYILKWTLIFLLVAFILVRRKFLVTIVSNMMRSVSSSVNFISIR